jgi:hypothetical protein
MSSTIGASEAGPIGYQVAGSSRLAYSSWKRSRLRSAAVPFTRRPALPGNRARSRCAVRFASVETTKVSAPLAPQTEPGRSSLLDFV